MSIADLVAIDDLQIPYDPQTYQDQTNPPPPLPGNYKLRIKTLVPRKDKDGQLALTDGKFPTFTIQRATVVEGLDKEVEFSAFADLRTKPYDRQGSTVTDIHDICRAIDQTHQWNTLQEGLQFLEESVAAGSPFACQIVWEGYDGDYVDAEFAKRGIAKGGAKQAMLNGRISKDDYSAIYKGARLASADFKPNGRGGLNSVAQGPSGAMVEAKPKIKRFFPSLTPTQLGPFKIKH